MNVRSSTVAPTVTDYLSWSRISAYLRCPHQYAMRYIGRVPAEHRPVALLFGTAWHDTVGVYLEGSGNATTPELVDVFAESFDHEIAEGDVPVHFDEDQTRDTILETARGMVEAFRKSVKPSFELIDRERSFSIELAHPVTGEILPVPVVGSIDAVISRNGEKLLWELKSSKRRWTADQLDNDGQVTLYQIAARSLGHVDAKLELVATTKTKKPDVQIERLVRHRRDEQELTELAFGVLTAIEAGVDYRVRGWQCRSCQWAGSCSP
ncbi:MAG: PD-(D/E)XK nuclease family protein [Candidatus Eisenbacteria bacterium]|nr:PD-(D/E)XK nuclease family protein [Candidatus Eisenbacteria bacterium]